MPHPVRLRTLHRVCDTVSGVNWRPTRFADELTVTRYACHVCRVIPSTTVVLPCAHGLCEQCHAGSPVQDGRRTCPLDGKSFGEKEYQKCQLLVKKEDLENAYVFVHQKDTHRRKEFCPSYFAELVGPTRARYEAKISMCDGVDPYTLCAGTDTTTDVELLPVTTHADIVNYLVLWTNHVSLTEMKAYKSLEAHNYFTSGRVSSVTAKRLPSKRVIVLSELSAHYVRGCKCTPDIIDEVGVTPPPAEARPEEGYEVVSALSSKMKELAEEIRIAVDQLQEFNSGLMSSLETISKFLERIEDGRRVQERARTSSEGGNTSTVPSAEASAGELMRLY
ncbi:hypothetical protein HPB52_014720 [Rhipicephalus sanguineus]|uniref:RING-type domain-containing protein n=1 Tax=Rhipicephalus sanguineus TaxID=34632 RepID=A0A9D4T5R0_RHISA|nr:hypothetical protein HPB52_014720 [Rhipicephalus sanguineus]